MIEPTKSSGGRDDGERVGGRRKPTRAAILTLIKAAQEAGLPVQSLEMRPDGAVRINVAHDGAVEPDLFAEWKDRL